MFGGTKAIARAFHVVDIRGARQQAQQRRYVTSLGRDQTELVRSHPGRQVAAFFRRRPFAGDGNRPLTSPVCKLNSPSAALVRGDHNVLFQERLETGMFHLERVDTG